MCSALQIRLSKMYWRSTTLPRKLENLWRYDQNNKR